MLSSQVGYLSDYLCNYFSDYFSDLNIHYFH